MNYRSEFCQMCKVYDRVKSIYYFYIRKYKLDLTMANKKFMSEFLENLVKEIVYTESLFYDGLNSAEYLNAMDIYTILIKDRIKASLANLLNTKL